MKKQGFSLMELLVVLGVIAMIMGLFFPALQRAIQRARITRARTEVETLQQAWLAYWNTYSFQENFTFPSVSQMDAAAVAILAGVNTSPNANPLGISFMEFDQRHLNEGVKDPWGNEYRVVLGYSSDGGPGTSVSTEWVYQTRVFLGQTARERY